MDKNTDSTIKDLVSENRLEDALNLMISSERLHGLERHNTLLLLKGKLSMIEEQELAGLLDMEEIMQQKLKIAHAILRMLAEKPEKTFENQPKVTERAENQKTSPALSKNPLVKYLLIGLCIVVAGFGLFRLLSQNAVNANNKTQPEQQQNNQNKTTENPSPQSSDKPLKVLNFPSLQLPFNFLDSGIDFRWAEAEWISDSEIRLNIRYYLTCKSNLGICYRPTVRIFADSRPIAPAAQSNTAGWVEKSATITDDIQFELPSDTKTFEIELSRDHSTWRRPFSILIGQ